MDRSGFHRTLTIQALPVGEDLSQLTLAQLADRAEEYARLAREAADAGAARLLPAATDGVLIDGGFEVP